MATWQDPNLEWKVWTYDDGKLDPEAWMADDADRLQKWFEAGNEYRQWLEANPGVPHQGKSAEMFAQWIEYANAVGTPHPPNTP
jgi:hypothetical protein